LFVIERISSCRIRRTFSLLLALLLREDFFNKPRRRFSYRKGRNPLNNKPMGRWEKVLLP
jgi:hypothetical protein